MEDGGMEDGGRSRETKETGDEGGGKIESQGLGVDSAVHNL